MFYFYATYLEWEVEKDADDGRQEQCRTHAIISHAFHFPKYVPRTSRSVSSMSSNAVNMPVEPSASPFYCSLFPPLLAFISYSDCQSIGERQLSLKEAEVKLHWSISTVYKTCFPVKSMTSNQSADIEGSVFLSCVFCLKPARYPLLLAENLTQQKKTTQVFSATEPKHKHLKPTIDL